MSVIEKILNMIEKYFVLKLEFDIPFHFENLKIVINFDTLECLKIFYIYIYI